MWKAKTKNHSFPRKLHKVLELAESMELMTWVSHGRGFCFIDKHKFMECVASKFFNTKRWFSFQRQLRNWGFKRTQQGKIKAVWYHNQFYRGITEEGLNMIKRVFPAPNVPQPRIPEAQVTNSSIHGLLAQPNIPYTGVSNPSTSSEAMPVHQSHPTPAPIVCQYNNVIQFHHHHYPAPPNGETMPLSVEQRIKDLIPTQHGLATMRFSDNPFLHPLMAAAASEQRINDPIPTPYDLATMLPSDNPFLHHWMAAAAPAAASNNLFPSSGGFTAPTPASLPYKYPDSNNECITKFL